MRKYMTGVPVSNQLECDPAERGELVEKEMDRAVFYGFHANPSVVLENVPLPEIQEGEILGKILVATVCGSDLHTLQGRRNVPTPSILGHEGVIEVVYHRRPNSQLLPGERLTFCMIDHCNKCDSCKDGLPQKCESLFKYSQRVISDGTGANGCYASHIVIRKNTHVFKIPSEIPNNFAAPINCALATMVNALGGVIDKKSQRKDCTRQRTALIQGAGLLGVYGCALLHEAGFEVYCSDSNPKRLEIVSKFGAIPLLTGQSSDNSPAENSIDVVVEVCGHRSVINEGIRLLRYGGKYVWVGLVHPDSKLDMLTAQQVIQKCLTIQGFHNYGPQHLDKAVAFLAQTIHKYPYGELFSMPYALKDFNDAVAMTMKQTYHRVCIEP